MKKTILNLAVLFALLSFIPFSSAESTSAPDEISVSFPEWIDEDTLDDNYIGGIMPGSIRLRAGYYYPNQTEACIRR